MTVDPFIVADAAGKYFPAPSKWSAKAAATLTPEERRGFICLALASEVGYPCGKHHEYLASRIYDLITEREKWDEIHGLPNSTDRYNRYMKRDTGVPISDPLFQVPRFWDEETICNNPLAVSGQPHDCGRS
jgi:hypothetical protein